MHTSGYHQPFHLSSISDRYASLAEQFKNVGIYPYAILIVLLNIVTIFLLFTLREADNNRLTSWQWITEMPQILTLCLFISGLLYVCWQARLKTIHINVPLGLYLLAFSIGLLLCSEPEVIVDNARYFTQAKYLAEYGFVNYVREWGYSFSSWTDLPLVPLIYGLMFKLLGESREVIQLTTLSMFAGTVVLTFYIGKTLWDEQIGLFGGALLLGMPFLLNQVPLMMVDVPSMFFLALAIWSILQVINQVHFAWLLLAAVCTAMAALAKYTNWLMLSVLPVLLLTASQHNWQQATRRLLWVLYGTCLLLAPFIVLKIDLLTAQLKLLTTYQLPALQRWQEAPVSTFFFQIHPFISLAALLSIYFAMRRRDRHYLPVVWMWLLILLLGINRSRYVIVALPMLALMAAYTLRQIPNTEIRQYLLVSIVISSVVLTVGAYRPFMQNTSSTNLQQAGHYLDQLPVEAVEVIVLPQLDSIINPVLSLPTLDLYTQKHLMYRADEDTPNRPNNKILKTSPLRFSWEYKLPDYYRDKARIKNRAIVVIASHPRQTLTKDQQQRLKDYTVSARFSRSERVFRYQTEVRVYEQKQLANRGLSKISQRE